jgi:hypothetical protein
VEHHGHLLAATRRCGRLELTGIHENVPPGMEPEDDEPGWKMSIDKPAALVETG